MARLPPDELSLEQFQTLVEQAGLDLTRDELEHLKHSTVCMLNKWALSILWTFRRRRWASLSALNGPPLDLPAAAAVGWRPANLIRFSLRITR